MQQIDILHHGGIMMWALIALSVYTLGVVIFKIWQFVAANIFERRFIEQSLRDIKQGERARAMQRLQGIRGPIARIMRVSFECVLNRDMSSKSKEAEITRVGSADIRYLESHLRGLEMAAQAAPLMGLLGTVIGLIQSFARLGEAGTRVDPSMLAGGIWEALLTTAGGLAVAIPALAAHYILDGMIERVRATMKDVAVQILALEDEFRRAERLRAVEEARAEESRRAEERRQEIAQMNYERQLETQRRDEERRYDEARREEELRRQEALLRQEAELRRAEAEAAANARRTAPELPETLALLKPNYSKV